MVACIGVAFPHALSLCILTFALFHRQYISATATSLPAALSTKSTVLTVKFMHYLWFPPIPRYIPLLPLSNPLQCSLSPPPSSLHPFPLLFFPPTNREAEPGPEWMGGYPCHNRCPKAFLQGASWTPGPLWLLHRHCRNHQWVAPEFMNKSFFTDIVEWIDGLFDD